MRTRAQGGGAAPKPQAWGRHSRRTPLVAGGFLVGALVGALPPIQVMSQRLGCTANGGTWIAAIEACELRAHRPFVLPTPPRGIEQDLLNEEAR